MSGLTVENEDATVCFCEELFAEEFQGHPLLKNRSHWRRFPTVTNTAWSHENVVIMGDAAHTAHFSVGLGTRIAMLDSAFVVGGGYKYMQMGEGNCWLRVPGDCRLRPIHTG